MNNHDIFYEWNNQDSMQNKIIMNQYPESNSLYR